jgi:hypothetical protein
MTIFLRLQRYRCAGFLPPAVVATVLTLFAACSNIKNDRTRTKVEGTSAGAAAGGALGGLIGGIVGLGSPDYIARGVLMGAQIGGGAGYSYGSYVANKKARYASTEAWLDACVAEVRQETKKSHDYNMIARAVIVRQKRRLAELKTATLPAVAEQTQTEVLRQRIDTSLTHLNNALRNWQLTVEAHRRVVARTRASARTETLQAEVDKLESQRKELETSREEFTALKAQISQ